MPITEADINLLKSERMNDDPDGGGYMTDSPVQSGVENNVFPDVSSLDRAQGALDFRKIYAAVTTADTDVFYGAHAIIDTLPSDPAVSALLTPGETTSEDRATVIADLQSGGRKFYGTKPITGAVSIGGRVVEVGSLTEQFIPNSAVALPVSGTAIPAISSPLVRTIKKAAGATMALEILPYTYSGTDYNVVAARFPAVPDSVSGGSITDSLGTAAIGYTQVNGTPYLTWAGTQDNAPFLGDNYYFRENGSTPRVVTAVAGTFQPAFSLTNIPAELVEIDYTSAMTPVINTTLPHSSELASELIVWTDDLGRTCQLANVGIAEFYPAMLPSGTWNPSASINRSTGDLSMLLNPSPKVGTKVQIYYCKTGYVQSIASGALSSLTLSGAGETTLTPSSNYTVRSAIFKIGTDWYRLTDSNVVERVEPNKTTDPSSPTTVVGGYNRTTGVISIPSKAGQTISEWRAVEVSNLFPATEITGWTIPANLDPASVVISGVKIAGGTWTATANSTGAFSTSVVSGTYDKNTGVLDLTFTEAVAASISYSAEQFSYTAVSSSVTGVEPAFFPTNGEVTIFRVSDLVVLHNTVTVSPGTVSNGQVLNAGRTNLADWRVFGNDGVEILTGFTENLTAGTLTFTDVTGYSQPVTATHRVELLAVVTSVEADGTIVLSKTAEHAYPANTSFLSSAVVFGDMQGRIRNIFQQSTWTGVWQDTIASGATEILADYNNAQYPITTTNEGSMKERWAIIFTSTTAFKVVGEQVGEIALGATGVACSPINPATGTPYFTIPSGGWGTGWATGNVLRFNTEGASAPIWAIRSTNPSSPFGTDKVTVSIRGDRDA